MNMTDILKEILSYKRLEVEALQQCFHIEALRRAGLASPPPARSMREAIVTSPTGIIAECKRASPSKGMIHAKACVPDVVCGYEQAGAAACSVLTDSRFFSGSLADLAVARQSTALPLLRKDFIISEYQIYQSRVFGASAILLIAAALSLEEAETFTSLAHSLGLEVLMEVHDCDDLTRCPDTVDMVGVNNRNLRTFNTDIAISVALAPLLPPAALKVSESGLHSVTQIDELRKCGYQGFLIGESFMRQSDPGLALQAFINGED